MMALREYNGSSNRLGRHRWCTALACVAVLTGLTACNPGSGDTAPSGTQESGQSAASSAPQSGPPTSPAGIRSHVADMPEALPADDPQIGHVIDRSSTADIPVTWPGIQGFDDVNAFMEQRALEMASWPDSQEVRYDVSFAAGQWIGFVLEAITCTDDGEVTRSSSWIVDTQDQTVAPAAALVNEDERVQLFPAAKRALREADRDPGTYQDALARLGLRTNEAWHGPDDVRIGQDGSFALILNADSGVNADRAVLDVSPDQAAEVSSDLGRAVTAAVTGGAEFAGLPQPEPPFVPLEPLPADGSGVMGMVPTENVDCSAAQCVALTFDDGPDANLTPKLLDVLASKGVHATFFQLGPSVAARPDITARAVNEGHVVGSHSWSHPQLDTLPVEGIRDEVARSRDAIQQASGLLPALMRPPYGATNDKVTGVLSEAGQAAIFWDVDSEDWKNRDVKTTTDRIMATVRAGSIVLMHDVHPSTIEAVPGIIDQLQRQGFTLVTVPTLLGGVEAGQSYY